VELDKFLKMVDTIRENLPEDTPLRRLQESYIRNPYTNLMVTLLSLRSKDERTAVVAKRLFRDMGITTPQELLKLSQKELEEIIKPIGFQKQKAKTLLEVSKALIDRFNSKVPDSKEELVSLKGVGEKTANVVLNSSFNRDVIAVDVHIHRVTNMWGVIESKNEVESSKILNKIIPLEYKKDLNNILVAFGQTICTPINPKCEICPVKNICSANRLN
jgi:endonuclease-3